ncbi:helix-turn-helix domain-containing protein [Nocardiopsis flavescens]
MDEDENTGEDAAARTMPSVVGARSREARLRRGLSLEEVAARTGTSASTLGRMESGIRAPSLDLLLPLARIYRVTLEDLLGSYRSSDPRVAPRPLRRGQMVYTPLTRRTTERQRFRISLPGRDPHMPVDLRAHGGGEWVYVLSGTLRLVTGDTVTDLARGEAADFDGSVPHGMASGDGEPVEFLALMDVEGERVHIRDAGLFGDL